MHMRKKNRIEIEFILGKMNEESMQFKRLE